jgi:hypothetical protein
MKDNEIPFYIPIPQDWQLFDPGYYKHTPPHFPGGSE